MYIMRTANIRLFLPGVADQSKRTWRGLALEYVRSIIEARLDVLLLAIPFVSLQQGDPFYAHQDLFFGRLAPRYINVVFGVNDIPKSHVLTGLREMQKKTNAKRGLDTDVADLDEPEPTSDLVRLWTANVKNVAMVGSWPRELTGDEIDALARYDYVFCEEGDFQSWDHTGRFPILPASPKLFATHLRLLAQELRQA